MTVIKYFAFASIHVTCLSRCAANVEPLVNIGVSNLLGRELLVGSHGRGLLGVTRSAGLCSVGTKAQVRIMLHKYKPH